MWWSSMTQGETSVGRHRDLHWPVSVSFPHPHLAAPLSSFQHCQQCQSMPAHVTQFDRAAWRFAHEGALIGQCANSWSA